MATFLGPRFAFAEEIPVVNVTEAGPDRSLPIGSFYVAGKAPVHTQRVQAFVVRTEMPWLFGGYGPSCNAVWARIHGDKLRETDTTKQLKIPAGQHRASSIWQTDEDYTTIATASWETTDDSKEQDFKLFVSDDDFFVQGASYCLFVARLDKNVEPDKLTLRKAVETLAQSNGDAAALDAFDAVLTSLKGDGAVLRARARDAYPHYQSLITNGRKAQVILNAWSTSVLVAKPLPPTDKLDVLTDPLGHLVAELLFRHGTLDRKNGEYYAGKLKVKALRFIDDFGDVIVSDAADVPGEGPRLQVGAADLSLESDDLTLLDLLELTRNRLRIGEAYKAVADLTATLNPVLRTSGALSQLQRDDLNAVAARLRVLARFLKNPRTPPPAPPAPAAKAKGKGEPKQAQGRPKAQERATTEPRNSVPSREAERTPTDLALDWIDTLLVRCGAVQLDDPTLKKVECADPTKPAPGWWPGYAAKGESPIDWLADALSEFPQDSDRWQAALETLVIEKTSYVPKPVSVPFGGHTNFTQKTWLFSYATPVVGDALVLGASENFNIGYVGLQVHLVPNPVDDPLWSRGGRDILRAFALEVALSLPATSYGPDDRFRGWKNLPPFFFGATAHVLPYVGVSFGGVVLERRSSTLPQEKYETFVSPYVGLNVQANIPDLVRQLQASSTTNTEH